MHRTQSGVEGFRTHRLRDTFVVELLLADVSIEDVSVRLGHSSVQTTERYYAPWDRSRRDRLTRIVRDAHKREPLLTELCRDPTPGPGGQIRIERASLGFQGIYGLWPEGRPRPDLADRARHALVAELRRRIRAWTTLNELSLARNPEDRHPTRREVPTNNENLTR